MVHNSVTLFNRIKKEKKIPTQWRVKNVKSTHKEEKSKRIRGSQRRMFLINMMHRVYKRAKKSKMKKSENVKYVNCVKTIIVSTADKFILMSALKEKQCVF